MALMSRHPGSFNGLGPYPIM